MPENSQFMVAAYVVAAVIYAVYTVHLVRKSRAALRQPRDG